MNNMIAKNRKVNFEYEIIEKFEAGICLLGSEVKSMRQGQVSLDEAFVVDRDGELFVINMHIAKYKQSSLFNHIEKRERKLLLKKREINKLLGQMKIKGLTIAVCSAYFNSRNKIKLEIALVKGKKLHDKRETIKQREWNREKARVFKNNQL